MRAVVITKPGGPEVLTIQERGIPKYQDHEVLIQVHAAGINRPDIYQRMGKYNAPKGIVQDIPGLEVAGVIVKIGSQVTNCDVGDEVFVLISGGGYAEYVVAAAILCIQKPANISFDEAAILPETIYTVWYNLFQLGKLAPTDKVLIHGGAGGIGSTAIQLSSLFGASIYTTVSSKEKEIYCQSLGALQTINYKEEDFGIRLKDEGISLILDSIAGEYFAKNMDILNEDGRLVYINAMKGSKVELNLLKLMQKRIQLFGSTLRSRDLKFKYELTKSIVEHVIPLIEMGAFRPQLFKTFSIDQVSDAHQSMEDGRVLGKISVKFLC